MHGSVRNIEDQPIKSNFTLNFEVPYSKCSVAGWVEVIDGFFETNIPVMVDHRNYMLQISLQNQYYLPEEWEVFIDTGLINSTRFDTHLTLTRINEH